MKKENRGGARKGAGRKAKIIQTQGNLTLSIPVDIIKEMQLKFPYKVSSITTAFYKKILADSEFLKQIK